MTEYLSVAQAAQRLGITPETVRSLIADGQLRAYKKTLAINSPFVVEAASVEAFDVQRRTQSQKSAA